MFNPLFINDYIFPIYILVLLVLTLVTNKTKNYNVVITQIDFLVAMFFVFYLIKKTIDSDVILHIPDYYMEISSFLIYIVFRLNEQNNTLGKKLVEYSLIVVVAFECVLALLQNINVFESKNPYFPATGSFISPAILTNFLCIGIPILMHLFSVSKKSFFSYLVLIIIGLTCFSTDSKLSWLVVVLVVCFEFSERFDKIPRKFFLIAGIILLFIIGAIFSQDSTSGRYFILKTSGSMFLDHFVNGIGIDHFDKEYNIYQGKVVSSLTSDKNIYLASYVETLYNDVFQFVLEGGLFALILVCSSSYIIYINWGRIPNYLRLAILIISVIAFFSFPFQTSSSTSFIILYLAIIARYCKPLKEISLKRFTIIPFVVIFSIYQLFIFFSFQNALLIWKATRKNPDIINSKAFLPALYTLKNNKDFQLFYANTLFVQNRPKEAIMILEHASLQSSRLDIFLLLGISYEKINRFHEAELNYRKCMHLIPYIVKPKYLLMKMLLTNGDGAKAKTVAKDILSMKPKIVSKEDNLMRQGAKIVIER